ncbi:MAG: hypothetical protein RIF37_01160 [Rhodospirillaceae bacterium]
MPLNTSKRFNRFTQSLLVLSALVVVAACDTDPAEDHSANIETSAPTETTETTSNGFEHAQSRFYEDDNPYAEIIATSEAAFQAMDIEGALQGLDDEFTMYEITEAGAEERVKGIAQVREAVGGIFGTGKWLGANVYKWGLTDNTLVQIEEDFFETEDGGRRSIKTLVVFEHRDGKRWREWRFKPEAK